MKNELAYKLNKYAPSNAPSTTKLYTIRCGILLLVTDQDCTITLESAPSEIVRVRAKKGIEKEKAK